MKVDPNRIVLQLEEVWPNTKKLDVNQYYSIGLTDKFYDKSKVYNQCGCLLAKGCGSNPGSAFKQEI